MLTKLKSAIMTLLFYICRIFPIAHNKIVVSSFAGKGYGDNGKAIVEELCKQDVNYDIVWLCKDEHAVFPDGVRAVPFLSIQSVYEQCTARVWIDNRRKPGYVRKRKGQYYIATNHGNHGLKKVEMDVPDALTSRYIWAAKRDSEMADLFLSSSRFDTNCFRTAYQFRGEILEAGYPRQDILIRDHAKETVLIKEKLNLAQNDHILLYAPTFRRSLCEMDLSVYDLDWKEVLLAFHARFGGEWKGLVRLHPNISAITDRLKICDGIVNVTEYSDFEELMLISDCVITDYSSTIIEAGIAGKMGLFFATDIEEYKKDRDFYIQLTDFPFPIATSNKQLINNILQFDQDKFEKDVQDFFHGAYGLNATGRSAALVAERIRKVIEYRILV